MRDVGILVWVVLLIVGVIGSMVSSLRKQAQSRPMPPQLPEWAQQIGAPQVEQSPQLPPWAQQVLAQARVPAARPTAPVPSPQAKKQPQPRPEPARHEPPQIATEERKAGAARLFADKRGIVRAVIAAEVLGKPRAFSDEYHGY